jgi:hypothetical protein
MGNWFIVRLPSVFIQIYSYDMLHIPCQCALRTDDSEILYVCTCVCVCVCVFFFYSLLLCVHLKWYLRHNQGKEEYRQSVTCRWGDRIAHLAQWPSCGLNDLEFDSKQKRFSSSPEHPDWLWGPPNLFNGCWGYCLRGTAAEACSWPLTSI